MTGEGVATALAFVRSHWPHSNLGRMDEAVAAWTHATAVYPDDEVGAALVRLRDSGREHAPAVSVVIRTVLAGRQGPPPSIEDAQRVLARLVASCSPYNARGPADTAVTVERLAARGVHEAVLRFVAERGVYAVRMMPDGDEFALDPNQLADRRDLARHYRDVTLVGWRQDPTPGVALERASAAAGEIGRGSLRPLGEIASGG